MKKLQQLLDEKGDAIWSVGPDESVFDAIKRMADKDIGSLVVMEADTLIGIVTERHYSRKVILQGKASLDTPVRAIMETRVLCAHPEQTVAEGMALMTEKRVRHLPVVADNRLLGVISIGDLVKSIIAEQEFIIDQLEHYIYG